MEKSGTKRWLAFAFANADLLLEIDPDLTILFAAGAVSNLMGVADGAAIGRRLDGFVAQFDMAGLTKLVDTRADSGRIDPAIVRLVHQDGRLVPVRMTGYRIDRHVYLTCSAVVSANGPPTDTVAVDGDHDTATGILNRAGFEASLAQRLEALQADGRSSAMNLVTIDKLDQVTETLGPKLGARVLAELGGTLRSASVDGQSAARIDPNRFALLRDADKTTAGLEKEITDIVAPVCPDDIDLQVSSASIRIPVFDTDSVKTKNILLHAINAFAETTANPFSRHAITGEFRDLLGTVFQRAEALSARIADGDVVVALQPIVTLLDRSIHHFEALVRFDTNRSPYETIKLAENTGLVCDLDLLMTGRVVDMLDATAQSATPVPVAVNISAVSLETDTFVAALETLLADRASLRPHLLIEITESMEIRDLDRANAVLQHLRSQGHKICLDDFGAGSSSFSYVNKLSIDYIKIDGSYIRDMIHRPRKESILRSMTSLCRDLRVSAIGEMIENDEEAHTLLLMGVTHGQGYLFGRPMISASIPAALGSARRADGEVADRAWRTDEIRRAVEAWRTPGDRPAPPAAGVPPRAAADPGA